MKPPKHFRNLLSFGKWTDPELFRSRNKTIPVAKCLLHFDSWSGLQLKNRYGKTALNFEGEAMFAELVILRLLQRDGFEGVWVDTYRNRFRQSMMSFISILQPAQERALRVLERIPNYLEDTYETIRKANSGRRGGCWDVMARKGNILVFVESKQNTPQCRDRIREGQRRWFETALSVGINTSSFVVCEWTISGK
jgi:hypothetical protein